MAAANKEKPGTSVSDVLQSHYAKYGRNFFSRYDYEEVDSDGAKKMMEHLRTRFADSSFAGSKLGDFTVAKADDFSYTDPIDKSVSKNQGLYVLFSDGSRVIFRLSGTGSAGATIRLYVEKYTQDASEYSADVQQALKPLIDVALQLSELEKFTGRSKPTVITVRAAGADPVIFIQRAWPAFVASCSARPLPIACVQQHTDSVVCPFAHSQPCLFLRQCALC